MTLNDAATVAREYATEDGLLGRRAAYRHATGPDAPAHAVEAVLETRPRRVLEVGCGPGEAAAGIQAAAETVIAVDISERMVELARGRGVDARVGDVQELPFPDGDFDCALAGWMLYHVPDVERALSELARVLRPGGRLVAVTNRADHLHELRLLVGEWPRSAFDDRSAPELLRRHFSHVEERDLGGWIEFPDQAAVRAYISSSRQLIAAGIPDAELPLRVRRRPVMYVATR